MTETILTNAMLVTPGGTFAGTLAFGADGIRAVEPGASRAAGAVDAGGDFVAPGLIECHTDNLERHAMPRPGVTWPNMVAAVVAHDAQMAAAGVTTVYDALCAGGFDEGQDWRRDLFSGMAAAVEQASAAGVLRLEHRLHLRCELTDPRLPEIVAPHLGRPSVGLASLMDHTPGQRQWRDLSHFRSFIGGERLSRADADRLIAERIARNGAVVARNWPAMVELFAGSGIVLASHDDTTPDDVAMAARGGCSISEFPTTLEAARTARAAGLAVVGGAPNVVRGRSHSGGVAMRDLAADGLVDALSSDYVPASLLQAAAVLHARCGVALHAALGLVTSGPADMLGLADRGRLAPGLRADIVRFRLVGETPVVAALYRGGRRVM